MWYPYILQFKYKLLRTAQSTSYQVYAISKVHVT